MPVPESASRGPRLRMQPWDPDNSIVPSTCAGQYQRVDLSPNLVHFACEFYAYVFMLSRRIPEDVAQRSPQEYAIARTRPGARCPGCCAAGARCNPDAKPRSSLRHHPTSRTNARLKHSSRNRALNDSINALSVGLPGRLKSSFTLFQYAHRYRSFEMNLPAGRQGRQAQDRCPHGSPWGLPCALTTRSRTCTTSMPRTRWPTCNARLSRV